MPNLKDIQRRIGSIKKTQQITRAMRMVAGAKLRRAQTASENARPYADRMRATVSQVSQGVSDDAHPLFEQRETLKKVEFVVATSDRGLCGGFNSNVIKFAEKQIAERDSGRPRGINHDGGSARARFLPPPPCKTTRGQLPAA